MKKATQTLAHATQNRLNFPVLVSPGFAPPEIGTLTAAYSTNEKLIREEHRVVILKALKRIVKGEAVAVLIALCLKADPITCCYTFKILFSFYRFHFSYFLILPSFLNYFGTPEARAFIAAQGPKDDDEDCRRLAERIGRP